MEVLISQNLNAIKSLLKKYNVSDAYVFGSAARNELTSQSDIDFLVNFSNKTDFESYGNNYFDLRYALQDLLKRDVDLVAEDTLNSPYSNRAY